MADETSASSLKTSTGGGLALESTVETLEFGYKFLKWLRQLRKCIQDAGLLEYLEDTVARPQKRGVEQVEFDRKRAIVNNTIFGSLGGDVQQEVADSLKGRLTSVSPRDLIRQVNSAVIWPAKYYKLLSEFTVFTSLYELHGKEQEVLRELHDDWDLLKACERGVPDEIYIGVVIDLLAGASQDEDFFGDIWGDMENFDLTAETVRTWLKAKFNLPEL